MVSGEYSLVAFISIIGLIYLAEFADKRSLNRLLLAALYGQLLLCVYCIASGIILAGGWPGLPEDMSLEGRKLKNQLFLIVVFVTWPYLLILTGAYVGYHAFGMVRNLRRHGR
ncbi:hypothetical protein DFP90_110100 [Aestuariispira insulae]|uniref:Uncharacterized protein n=2 Tax=Aestuariispira insulae TaxID=1461337 RepID=A0A3D9HAI5_9PROT|nr:hypothetical protein DFP90_110100 [Aestuariispira insulae]